MRRLDLILAAGLCLHAAEARAQLTVCNDTEIEIYAALAAPSDSTSGDGWTSSGWFVFGPHACGDLAAELRFRYYYLYAETTRFRASVRFGDREVWGHSDDQPLIYGDFAFCVSPADAFEITEHADCEARGLASAGFREIDVGDHTHFVLTIGAEE